MSKVLEMKQIVKQYKDGFQSLRGVDFSLDKGEIVAIIGPSGSGKSSLLRCVNGLNTVTSGEIKLEGQVYRCAAVLLPGIPGSRMPHSVRYRCDRRLCGT